ncbi:TrmH family RNA methyltransferase [Psychrobacter pygoscelis]|uniref:TrmH family RNA methyltransferase n=1 Tax=Psychrobacter pygoscelis TaxID=2488563 RepID=UPI00103F3DF1|nr:RNA methyltransferase [Psychrobacter pygoscelis]
MTFIPADKFANNPVITSDKNPTVKLAKGLISQSRQRKKAAQTVLEGVHLLESMIQNDIVPVQILVSYSALTHPGVQSLLVLISDHKIDNRLMVLSDSLYDSIKTLGTGLDIMAIINIPEMDIYSLKSPITTDCLILNDVQDNGNVGTLLRTAAAVGIKTIICTTGTAQAWSPKTMRAGMGAQFGLTIYEGVAADEVLAYLKVPVLATSSHTDNIIYQQNLNRPVAWVMGHEGQGVCDTIMQSATPVALPQPNGQESLNVAIAGSLCLYETLRQRNYAQ